MPKGDSTRRKLLALLKEGRGDWKLLVSNDKVRVQWQDHPNNSVAIQELPRKPLKRQLKRRTYSTYYLVQHFHPGDVFLMSNLLQDAKLTSSMSFEQAVHAMDAALERAKAELLRNETYKKYKESHPGIYHEYTEKDFTQMGYPKSIVRDEEVYFLEVEPADYNPIAFAGKNFGGTSEWTKFKFYDDKDDDEYMRQMEGMQAFYDSKSAGGARNLFKLLKADPDAVKGMTIEQFKAWLIKNKIAFDYVPTVWR
jgi:hypothetical protein